MKRSKLAGVLVPTLIVLGATGCGPTFTPAQYVQNYGPGFEVLLDAAEAADAAYELISDSPITELRDDGPTRKKVAQLVTAARDKYRKARSYKIPCEPNYEARIAGAVSNQVYVYDSATHLFSWTFKPPGRTISVLARFHNEANVLRADGRYALSNDIFRVDYLMSSRGKMILGTSCKRELPASNSSSQHTWNPKDSGISPNEFPIHPAFRPLLLGDEVKLDDIIVNIKR